MNTKLGTLLIALKFLVFVAIGSDLKPSYGGRSFSEWASQLDPHMPIAVGQEPPEVVAIGHIGTNALPILVQWISQKDPAGTSCLHPSRGMQAVMGFGILGSTARPTIPKLTRLAMSLPDRERYERCVQALACIGPESLPSFNTFLTKGHPEIQFSAIGWLPAFHTNAVVVMPAVIRCLTGRNKEVGWKAADELSRLDIPAPVLIPALTNALPSASASARARILRCLLWIGPPARGAVPAIRAALKDSNRLVREEATNALQYVDLKPN